MRPLLAFILSLLLIGGMTAYIQFSRNVLRPPISVETTFDDAQFELQVERTFDAVADPLAELDAITVRFRDNILFRSDDSIPRDQPIRVAIPEGVELGLNEFNVTANRDFLDTELAAMVITLFRNDVPLKRATVVSEPDLPTVSGSVVFDTGSEESHEH